MAPFSNSLKVRVYDTDAAGILYFAAQFRFVQDTFEAFFESIGTPIPEMVAQSPYIAPAVRAEAEYYKTLKAGMRIEVAVEVAKLGTTSMTLAYNISGPDGTCYGRARMVYVFVSRDSGEKRPIPTALRTRLAQYAAGQIDF